MEIREVECPFITMIEHSIRFVKSERDCSGHSGVEWLAAKDRLQGSQERHALLAHREEVARMRANVSVTWAAWAAAELGRSRRRVSGWT